MAATQRQQQQISFKDERIKKLQYEKRKSTLFKGGKELSTLCDINVCVVILSPDGKLETCAENLNDVRVAFRKSATPNKRPSSDHCRKPPAQTNNPSKFKIVLDDHKDDKKASKKMKAAISDEIRNNVSGEGGGGGRTTEVLVMGEKTEDHHHHHQLSQYNSCGNYHHHQEGFPLAFGEWNDSFAERIGNYENPISCSSNGSYGGGGGGYSSSIGYEIQNLHNNNHHVHEWNYSDDYASGNS